MPGDLSQVRIRCLATPVLLASPARRNPPAARGAAGQAVPHSRHAGWACNGPRPRPAPRGRREWGDLSPQLPHPPKKPCQTTRSQHDKQARIVLVHRIEMDVGREHVPDDREGWFDVGDALFHGPQTESGRLRECAHGNRPIPIPAQRPVRRVALVDRTALPGRAPAPRTSHASQVRSQQAGKSKSACDTHTGAVVRARGEHVFQNSEDRRGQRRAEPGTIAPEIEICAQTGQCPQRRAAPLLTPGSVQTRGEWRCPSSSRPVPRPGSGPAEEAHPDRRACRPGYRRGPAGPLR